jgi:hypothetical protein
MRKTDSTRHTESAAVEECRGVLPPLDPQCPVRNTLVNACAERWGRYIGLTESLGGVNESWHQEEIVALSQRIAKNAKEALELLSWVYSNPEPLSVDRGLHVAQMMRKVGIVGAQVEDVLKSIGKRGKGRPAIARKSAIEALEKRLADPRRWTWPKITAQLCRCGKEHDIKCQDNIRREVLHLTGTMKRLGCEVRPLGKTPRVSPMR